MKVAVIGLGLIGGSLLRALAAAGHTVVGFDTDPATRAMARTAAAQARSLTRWQVAKTISQATDGADLTVVATPLPAVASVFSEIAGAGYTGLVTDAVSVKQPVRELAAHHLRWGDRDGRGPKLAGFVAGHPMAGRETAGFTSGDAELFTGCAWVLCLDPETLLPDWLTVAQLLTPLGSTRRPRHLGGARQGRRGRLARAAHPRLGPRPGGGRPARRHARRRIVPRRHPGRGQPHRPDRGHVRWQRRARTGGPGHPAGPARRAREALRSDDPVTAMRAWAEPGNTARSTWPQGWGLPSILIAEPKELLALGEAGGWITAVAPDRRTVTAVRPLV